MRSQIKVGGVYISKKYSTLAREILSETNGGNMHWRGYDLTTGIANDQGVCSKETIVTWMSREATPEEINKLNRAEAVIAEIQRANDLARTILLAVPDDWLLEEVQRRGLTIEPK